MTNYAFSVIAGVLVDVVSEWHTNAAPRQAVFSLTVFLEAVLAPRIAASLLEAQPWSYMVYLFRTSYMPVVVNQSIVVLSLYAGCLCVHQGENCLRN